MSGLSVFFVCSYGAIQLGAEPLCDRDDALAGVAVSSDRVRPLVGQSVRVEFTMPIVYPSQSPVTNRK